jgi:hypothetical protein
MDWILWTAVGTLLVLWGALELFEKRIFER